MATLFAVGKRVTDHDVPFVGVIAVRQQVIGLLPELRGDVVLGDEANHVDRVLGFELEFVQLLGTDEKMMPLGMLVALNDLLLGNLFKATLGVNTLQVSDRLPRWRVDHAERDRFLSGRGGVESDRNEDERETEVAGPERRWRHRIETRNAT
jgi:hypothetical protein